jgi:phosphate transport system protein
MKEVSMPVHLQREIERLKKLLLSLCAVVEESVRRAVESVQSRDSKLAEGVVGNDAQIDQSEIDVEEECLKILALHQPVAIDLRYIIAVLKLNNDLERIGDLAVNIAERALLLNAQPKIDIPFDLAGIAAKTQRMFRCSLDALVNVDGKLAREVCAMDDEVDQINRAMYEKVQQTIRAHPENLDALIALLSISRYLERIADHATNIAEDVIYMIDGRIARHGREFSRKTNSGAN